MSETKIVLKQPKKYHYKVEVFDYKKRKRIIRDNINKKVLRKHPVPIKGKTVDCKVVLLPIGAPIYHLNNGRTRADQSFYINEHNHKDNWFRDGLENNKQQNLQHRFLVDSKSFKELCSNKQDSCRRNLQLVLQLKKPSCMNLLMKIRF